MSENAVKLPNPDVLIVSSSPHVHDTQDVPRIMLTVVIALLPACIVGAVLFGWPAVRVMALCALGCMMSEIVFCKWLGRPVAIEDLSAFLTGLLLGMNLPPWTPWWVCILGAVLAMGLGKHIYGGLGYNPFNPALVGRVALLIAFPSIMTMWGETRFQVVTGATPLTTATPLGAYKTAGIAGTDYMSYFLGNTAGCIGETSALALLVGGLILIAFKLIRWQVPATYIGTVVVITGIIHLTAPEASPQPTPLFHILTGGLLLGAFFMATDMVTSPMTKSGAVIFGVGCGILTSVIRIWGSYPEGVSFSILFMNALTPLIDRFTAHRPFGARSKKVAA